MPDFIADLAYLDNIQVLLWLILKNGDIFVILYMFSKLTAAVWMGYVDDEHIDMGIHNVQQWSVSKSSSLMTSRLPIEECALSAHWMATNYR